MFKQFIDERIHIGPAQDTEVLSLIVFAFCHKTGLNVMLALIMRCDVPEDVGFRSDPAVR